MVFVEGGLGNQLFHCAFCYALKRKINRNVYLDCTGYKKTDNSTHNLEIKHFDLDITIITTTKDLSAILQVNFYLLRFKKILNKILVRLCKKWLLYPTTHSKIIFYPHLHYKNIDELALDIGDRIYIYGEYLWHFSHFLSHRAHFLATLYPKIRLDSSNALIYKKIKMHKNSCAIHIRSGDFVGKYELLGMDYYKMAMDMLRRRYSDVAFFVFGNDFDLTRSHFIDDDCTIVCLNDESKVIYDFVLMHACTYKILANSTLSMWLGFLSKGEVIYKANVSPIFTFSAENIIAL